MLTVKVPIYASSGRSPHGERGLKFVHDGQLEMFCVRRSPHGERGLKSDSAGVGIENHSVALLMESVD